MAITHKFTRTLPTPSATHSGFVFLLSAGWFTQADQGAAGSPIDGGTNSLANGGGDLQAFSDEACTQRLPVHVVEFVTGVSPSAQVWVRLPTWTSGDSITIGKDDTQTVQPAVTDTYGRNAVYQNETHRQGGNGATDVTGSTTVALAGTATQTGVVNGFDAIDLNGNAGDAAVFENTNTENWTGDFTASCWTNLDNFTNNFACLVGIRDGGQWEFHWRLEGNQPALLIGGSSPNSTGTLTSATDYHLAVTVSGSSISFYLNGASSGSATVSGSRANRTIDLSFGGLESTSTTDTSITGRIAQARAINGTVLSSSYISDEYTNQSDPDNFGTSGAWEALSSGIDVTAGFIVNSAYLSQLLSTINSNSNQTQQNDFESNNNVITSIDSTFDNNNNINSNIANNISSTGSLDNTNNHNSTLTNSVSTTSVFDNVNDFNSLLDSTIGSSGIFDVVNNFDSSSNIVINIPSNNFNNSNTFSGLLTVEATGALTVEANFNIGQGFDSTVTSAVGTTSNMVVNNTFNETTTSVVQGNTTWDISNNDESNINNTISSITSFDTNNSQTGNLNNVISTTTGFDITNSTSYQTVVDITSSSDFNLSANYIVLTTSTISTTSVQSINTGFTANLFVGTFNPILADTINFAYIEDSLRLVYLENNIGFSLVENTINLE